MGLRHCRIRVNHRRKLIEYFVMEVTARLAADVIGVHPNTAALFTISYVRLLLRKLRMTCHLMGRLKLMRVTSVGLGRVNAVVGRLAKCQSLACSNVAVRCMLCPCQTHQVKP